ncbi:hypothetical protein PITCH_A780094 [uncultured Desulfobacterium sp.]|uniref:Uncharacterized protein n=1 Tax=uncultured Desulfobacterium sp. TaxID=201089 RepID=A0A445N2N8_9BACT|nr:hypothetical protein PITCH_A780094 [uncultured Desulfobacterium sp.]
MRDEAYLDRIKGHCNMFRSRVDGGGKTGRPQGKKKEEKNS